MTLQGQSPARPKAQISLLMSRRSSVSSPQNRPAPDWEARTTDQFSWSRGLTSLAGTHSGPCPWSVRWSGCLFTLSSRSDHFRGRGCQVPGAGRTLPPRLGVHLGAGVLGGGVRDRARPGGRTQAIESRVGRWHSLSSVIAGKGQADRTHFVSPKIELFVSPPPVSVYLCHPPRGRTRNHGPTPGVGRAGKGGLRLGKPPALQPDLLHPAWDARMMHEERRWGFRGAQRSPNHPVGDSSILCLPAARGPGPHKPSRAFMEFYIL